MRRKVLKGNKEKRPCETFRKRKVLFYKARAKKPLRIAKIAALQTPIKFVL